MKSQAQNVNRAATKANTHNVVSLPAEPRLQASIDVLAQSLKANANSAQDQLKSLLFTDAEFEAIFEQTYGKLPDEKDKATFQQKKSEIVDLFNQFRDPNLQIQVLNVTERSGDNSLRAMVVTAKFTHQNLNKITKLIMIKFNQVYKIMMLDL